MDPLRAALAPPPDSRSALGRLRANRAAWMREYRALRAKGHPAAAHVVLALDPVLVLDEHFEAHGEMLEDALRIAPDAGPQVHAGLLRAHARIWTIRGGHRVARREIAEARRIAAGEGLRSEPVLEALVTFGAVHAAFGLGLVDEVGAETRALGALARGAAGTKHALRIEALASQAAGVFAMMRGSHGEAVESYERAIDWARRGAAERTLATTLANRAFSLREQGEDERAKGSLLSSLALFRALDDRIHAAMVEGSLVAGSRGRGPLDVGAVLRAARASEQLGDARSAASLLITLAEREGRRARTEVAGWLDRVWRLLARVDAPSLEARARQLTELWGPGADGAETPVLEVQSDGTMAAFGGRVIDLRTRRALPRVLLALATARLEEEGAYLSVRDVFEAGWPGEKALEHAASARVYMAVRALRSLGLQTAIATSPAGYRIDPAVTVRLVPARAQAGGRGTTFRLI